MESKHLRETLNRRSRSLALMRPLFDLETNKGRQPELNLQGLDLFRMSSVALDVVITEMGGFQRGATYEQVLGEVAAQLRKVEPEADGQRCDQVASFTLDALTNERARDAFRLEYQHEAEDGRVVWSPLVFKLVELRDLDGSGDGRYVASAEAINIYLNSLGVELEGQQAADDAALRHFIQHGKLDEAELAARVAMMRTIEDADRIRRALQLIERGVSDFDWVVEMLPRLNSARNHIEERLRAEESLIVEAENKMEGVGSEDRGRLLRVREQLEVASRVHNDLFNVVLGANHRFMEEHARQRFRPVALNPFPNPQSAVLRPLLRFTLGEADAWLKATWFLLHPPRLKPLPDFALMTKALLQPRHKTEPAGEVVADTEFDETHESEPAFPDSAWAAFHEVFAQMPEQFRLSECLDRLPAGDDAARRLALLRVGQWFEGRADDPDVQPMGARFECGEFYGDDLLVTKRG